MNTPYRDMLIDVHDWQAERKARELAFYRDALAEGELSIVPGKERTTRKCKCDVCLAPQEPGIRKFWFRGKVGGFWWFRACEKCYAELVDAHVPVIAQVLQSVIS